MSMRAESLPDDGPVWADGLAHISQTVRDRLAVVVGGLALVEAVVAPSVVPDVASFAADTLRYFADQDVMIKVISGDNHDTVAAIAERAGLEAVGPLIDARTLSSPIDDLDASLEAGIVFGRVAPRQKQDMVRAL